MTARPPEPDQSLVSMVTLTRGSHHPETPAPKACEHDWKRAPDRDLVQGSFANGKTHLYSRVIMVFYCSRCLATEKREVVVEP